MVPAGRPFLPDEDFDPSVLTGIVEDLVELLECGIEESNVVVVV